MLSEDLIVLEGGRECVDEISKQDHPKCKNRSRGFFFNPNPGGTLEGKWEKHKLNRRTRDVRELHRRSDLVEISNVSMRVFFVMSKKLFILNKSKQTMLKLKVVRGDLGNNDGKSSSVSRVAYRLRLPEELKGVHDTFHVSNLKKCLADPTLQVPLDEIRVDAKLNFVEETVEILER
ncbi:hypothetical protein Tco_0837312 [Tanacetum coccineum]